MKQKILLLEGDYTQSLPMARSLAKRGYIVDGIFESKLSYGYGSRYFDKKMVFPEVGNMEKFHTYLLSVLKYENYAAVVPLNDDSSTLLSRYKEEFLKYTKFVLPDFDKYSVGYDKHQLMNICKVKGYPHPETICVEGNDLNAIDLSSIRFPLLIKPNYTSGARGMTLCNNESDLKQAFPSIQAEYGDCHIQRFVPKGGHQVEVQLYVNEKGELVQSSVIKKFRWYPENGGSSCCNISCVNKEIVDICYRLLLDIGWIGFADFDTIEDPNTGELLIMEINPRVPACVKSAFASGIDWADVIVSEYLGKEHQRYSMGREVYLRHLGFETLWFAYSKNRWKTTPNWFKLIGSNIYYQDMSSWLDPMPFIRGSWGNIKKQLDPKFREAKSGTRTPKSENGGDCLKTHSSQNVS